MAKKSMIVKANRKPKYKVREYTRCSRCGRPHAVMSKFGICRICFRELAYKLEFIHPTTKQLMKFEIEKPLDTYWTDFTL